MSCQAPASVPQMRALRMLGANSHPLVAGARIKPRHTTK